VSTGLAGYNKLFLCLLLNLNEFDEAPKQAEQIVRIAKAAGVSQVVASTTLGTSMLDEG
jgi:hypothetical protein